MVFRRLMVANARHGSMNRSISKLKYEAVVEVLLKEGVSDPEGVAILDAVVSLGYGSVTKVASGKFFRLMLHAEDEHSAADVVTEIAERLLSNPVLEDFRVRDLISANS